ncbi:MAG: hypothetical protein K8F56_18880 [Rhodocyclaceae bacterium]|nr:hypothetical protein [Rhodocyclaceae bacterium]
MAKPKALTLELLRWSDHVPMSDVQDPLGLSLRGSARLASRLLYCITSITPRARYFSFLPWAISDWSANEKHGGARLGLREALIVREKALVLGCIVHHEGKPCEPGRLVGSDNLGKWFRRGLDEAELKKVDFAKNPAFDAYFNSLVNLGVFVTEEERPDAEEEDSGPRTIESLELAPLGRRLAERYAAALGPLRVLGGISSRDRRCRIHDLREMGRRGGFCELSTQHGFDRELLRDIFFAIEPLRGEAHRDRKRSLLLLLEIARNLATRGMELDVGLFGSTVYFGEVLDDSEKTYRVAIPPVLQDIADRWRMFYFHYFLSVALEGVFSWLVGQAGLAGFRGCSLKKLTNELDRATVRKAFERDLGVEVPSRFGESSPADYFHSIGLRYRALDARVSLELDRRIRAAHATSELRLENSIRSGEYVASPAGLAFPLVPLAMTLSRFARWEDSDHGHWLGNVSTDPYLDLVPPVVSAGLERRLGSWWEKPWRELAQVVLSRFVLQQHQSLSYEKSAAGDRCIFQVDGDRVVTRPGESYEKLNVGNPRLGSAIQILFDLGLLAPDEEGGSRISDEGLVLLKSELARLEGA